MTGDPSALSPNDIEALSTVVAIQGDIGAPELNAERADDFMAKLWSLSFSSNGNFEQVTNSSLKRQLETFYAQLIVTNTSYDLSFPHLFLAYMWGSWMRSDAPPDGATEWHYQGLNWIQALSNQVPAGPTDWKQAVASAKGTITVSTWPHRSAVTTRQPGALIFDMSVPQRELAYPAWATVYDYQFGLIDPTMWTDFNDVSRSSPGLWATQSSDLSALLKASGDLADSSAIYLLFLFTGLCSSPTPSDVELVARIGTFVTSSPEYPNATLADQLVYLTLMLWADPRGNYQWTNAQLDARVHDLIGAVTTGNAAAQIMSKTLTTQAAILKSTSSYPMVDPYNPSIGFDQRKSDTLFAIGKAWASLRQ